MFYSSAMTAWLQGTSFLNRPSIRTRMGEHHVRRKFLCRNLSMDVAVLPDAADEGRASQSHGMKH